MDITPKCTDLNFVMGILFSMNPRAVKNKGFRKEFRNNDQVLLSMFSVTLELSQRMITVFINVVFCCS